MMRTSMSQYLTFENKFLDLSFSQKVRMSYGDWCKKLFLINFDKKFYKEVYTDLSYMYHYFTFQQLFSTFLLFIVWLTNFFAFPLYAVFMSHYWESRYKKILSIGKDPLHAMIVYSLDLPHLNGLKVVKILSDTINSGIHHYRVVLENKDIVEVNETQLLSKNTLIVRKSILEKELKNINYKLDYFKDK